MARLRWLVPVVLGLAVFGGPPSFAQEATLGGGSDIRSGTVVSLPRGVSLPLLHHVFADNRERRPVEVEFRSEAPPGIGIVPERQRLTIAPGESVKDLFSITIADRMPAGEHRVTVQLVRADIPSRPGVVTNIPAVGTTFTIRVLGESATVRLKAVSAQSRRPVEGTLTLTAVAGPGSTFEVARANGSELAAQVAPGDYQAAYLLEGRELASKRLSVAADESPEAVLQVETVSFVTVAARPVKEEGRVVVADLIGSVDNHLRPLAGPVTIRAVVHRDREQIGTATLEELDGLPLGVTEAKLTYRPDGGFPAGTYRFSFELASGDFTLRASTEPNFRVGKTSPTAIAATAVAAVAVLGIAGWVLLRPRLRSRGQGARRSSP